MNPIFRVLFVSSNQGGGGSEELWVQTAVEMARRGIRVSAATTWSKRATRRVGQLTKGGVCHEALRIDGTVPRILSRLRDRGRSGEAVRLLRLLHANRPELVVFNSGTSLDGVDLLEVLSDSGIPYVAVTHLVSTDNWPDDETAERLHETFSRAVRACFVSQHNRELFERQCGSPLPNAEIVWNPYLVSAERPLDWPDLGEGSRVWKLAFPARLHPKTKGQDMLIELLKQPEWQSRPMEVTLFGEGGCRSSLERLAHQGKDLNVIFGGQVDDVEGIWRTHHALILPSRHEGLPICLVEAMMAGRPVFVNPAGGAPELVEDGVTGLVGRSCEPRDLGDLMERAWTCRNNWQTMGQKAAQSVRRIIPSNPVDDFIRQLGAWWDSTSVAKSSRP